MKAVVDVIGLMAALLGDSPPGDRTDHVNHVQALNRLEYPISDTAIVHRRCTDCLILWDVGQFKRSNFGSSHAS